MVNLPQHTFDRMPTGSNNKQCRLFSLSELLSLFELKFKKRYNRKKSFSLVTLMELEEKGGWTKDRKRRKMLKEHNESPCYSEGYSKNEKVNQWLIDHINGRGR